MNGTDYAVGVLAAGSVKGLETNIAYFVQHRGPSPISSPRGETWRDAA